MTRYAKQATVPVSRTKAEIERTLERYGADAFISGWNEHDEAMIGFKMKNRSVRFIMPSPDSTAYLTNKQRDQDERASWRALLLLVKAKLEAVEAGFTVFEEEFLSHIVTDSGETVYERLRDQIGSTQGPLLFCRQTSRLMTTKTRYDWAPGKRGDLLMPVGSTSAIQQGVQVTGDVLEKLYRAGRLTGSALDDALQRHDEGEKE